MLFYDEAHRMCLDVQEKELVCYSMKGERVCLKMTLPAGAKVDAVKVDWDMRSVAVVLAKFPAAVSIYKVSGVCETLFCHRAKNNVVRGIYWTHMHNLVLVTSNSVELYSLQGGRAKMLKEVRLNVRWFSYHATVRTLLVGVGGAQNHVVLPLYFRQHSVEKLPKFDVETQGEMLHKDDLVAMQIYGRLYVLHSARAVPRITMYQVTRERVSRRMTIQHMLEGTTVVQLVDHLLIIHGLQAKLSVIYDIRAHDPALPIVSPLPMRPRPVVLQPSDDADPLEFDPYAKSLRFLQPNLVMQLTPTEVTMWEVVVNLEDIALELSKPSLLAELLMRRSCARPLLLRTVRSFVKQLMPLQQLAEVFDTLNEALAVSRAAAAASDDKPDASSSPRAESPAPVPVPPSSSGWTGGDDSSSASSKGSPAAVFAAGGRRSVLTQNDLYAHVFSVAEDEDGVGHVYLLGALTEYVRSLNFRHVEVEYFLFEMIIDVLVRHKMYFQLHQFLQYHVIADSFHVACQLLSLEKEYPPCHQLALDMLQRLAKTDELLEVMLARGVIISALRLVASSPDLDVPCTRVLDAAARTHDPHLFCTVFRFFQARGDISRAPECLPYVQAYSTLLETGSLPPSLSD